jgi:vancomycin aglycone glucosyltransferase
LSTIGSRGDVQPLVALALHLKSIGREVRICAPPDFREWIEGLGLAMRPIGPEVRKFAAARPAGSAPPGQPTPGQPMPGPPTPEQRRQMAEATVATQFETITAAAQGCDLIIGATALQIAARSVAETLGIPYVFVAYAATVLPSPHHPPPALPPIPGLTPPATADNRELWRLDAARFNDLFGPALNRHRASLGLSAVSDVRSHVFTDRPWLAADPTLGPWPDPADTDPADADQASADSANQRVRQTGAWILPDDRPLSPELEAFLAEGEPPIYFGFGSTRAPQAAGQMMLDAARALGRRAIVSRGWFDGTLVDNAVDCLSIGDANFHALFPRVAAVVHHGGAGTTTAAAMAGAPQVVVPEIYDQPYWGRQVERLGIGTAITSRPLTSDSLTRALEQALTADVKARAIAVAPAVRRDGVEVAAQALQQATRLL